MHVKKIITISNVGPRASTFLKTALPVYTSNNVNPFDRTSPAVFRK